MEKKNNKLNSKQINILELFAAEIPLVIVASRVGISESKLLDECNKINTILGVPTKNHAVQVYKDLVLSCA